jgi:DNA modification methylase
MERIITGDALAVLRNLPSTVAHTCVTSPPYFRLRDYGVRGQIGLEETPDAFVYKLVEVFREVRRVLRDDGTLWLNLGDSYAAAQTGGNKSKPGDKSFRNKGTLGLKRRHIDHGLKPKDLIGIPWRVAFALQADGWYLRQDIIWHKPNPMPESVTDRCTKAHEYIFLLTKSPVYYYDHLSVKEAYTSPLHRYGGPRKKLTDNLKGAANPYAAAHRDRDMRPDPNGRNRRSVWTVPTRSYKGAHFATFPPALIEPCILAGAPIGGVVLDPFLGSGTTAVVANTLGRCYVGVELNPSYVKLARDRLRMVLLPVAAE